MVFGPAGEVALTPLASEPFAQVLSPAHGSVESFVTPTTPLPRSSPFSGSAVSPACKPARVSHPPRSSSACHQALAGPKRFALVRFSLPLSFDHP
ncbi:hypothetical protein EV363DRAFT_1160141 [Boletus edulis]|nr:hypothetical protein EV363DRAFT_1178323 [Boletus edulis]KAF8134874.1 hypothetical protein EV363DRAFT_1160141 [Boletus edulis]